MNTLSVLAGILLQDDGGGIIAAIGGLFMSVCWLAFMVIMIAGFWKTFEKANQPGWASLIPFYNLYIMLKIVGRPSWWLILFFIPVVNFVAFILLGIDMARSFGKSDIFGIVILGFFNVIGYLIIGFGDAEYQGPSAS